MKTFDTYRGTGLQVIYTAFKFICIVLFSMHCHNYCIILFSLCYLYNCVNKEFEFEHAYRVATNYIIADYTIILFLYLATLRIKYEFLAK